MRRLACLVFCTVVPFFVGVAASAQAAPLSAAWQGDLVLGASLRNTDAEGLFPLAEARLGYSFAGFGVDLDFLARRDGLYPSPESQFQGIYFLFKSGGLSYATGPLALRAGVTQQYDLTDSPYSLFFSSKGNSPLSASVIFDDGAFFYETRWVGLNGSSALYRQAYPVRDASGAATGQTVDMPFDRGVNYRSFGLHLGNWRLAYQEATTYTGQYFDPWYFLLPVPAYFTQYVRNASGAPWQTAKPWGDFANDNFITGLLLDYRDADWYGVAQLLIDDINLNRFIAPDSYQNPDKIALDIGARWSGEAGRFGLFTALATKYTWQPFGDASSNTRYGYYYYPATETGWGAIPRQDNAIGFINGENNWSIRAEWDNDRLRPSWYDLGVRASLEFTLTGAQSPAKPWTDYGYYSDGGQGTKWLDDPVLEKKLMLRAGAELPLQAVGLTLGLDASLGYVWNQLELDWPAGSLAEANRFRLWRPSSSSRFLGSLDFSVTVHAEQLAAIAAKAAAPAPGPASAQEVAEGAAQP